MSIITNHTFLTGLQCHKAFWIDTHSKHFSEPSFVDSIYKDEHKALVQLFQNKISKPNIRTFVEYSHEKTCMSIDMVVDEPDGVIIYAVNSVVGPKWTQIKLLSFWYFVLTQMGIVVKDAVAVYVDRDYIRGSELDAQRLFLETSVLNDVLEQQLMVEAALSTLTHVLHRTDCPQIDIGEQCNRPHPCSQISTCWKHVPHPSVFDLLGLSQKDKFKWFRKGIVTFSEIPNEYPLSHAQSIQIQSDLTRMDHIDQPALKEFLEGITFPVYFIDFEAAQYTIPPYEGMKPFQAIPFQYSIHYIMSETDRVHHSGFISPLGEDPRYPLAKALSSVLSAPKGTLIAFNADLERQTFGQLASLFPEFRDQFLSLQSRIVDLAIPFNKMHYYSSKMGGKRSIKSLFHAKVGTVPYENLQVMNGETASKVYSRLHTIADPKQQTAILADLMRYCHMDTLAMVRLWQEIILATS